LGFWVFCDKNSDFWGFFWENFAGFGDFWDDKFHIFEIFGSSLGKIFRILEYIFERFFKILVIFGLSLGLLGLVWVGISWDLGDPTQNPLFLFLVLYQSSTSLIRNNLRRKFEKNSAFSLLHILSSASSDDSEWPNSGCSTRYRLVDFFLPLTQPHCIVLTGSIFKGQTVS
jgi:hypothetical protein